jgi:hypothetical protein
MQVDIGMLKFSHPLCFHLFHVIALKHLLLCFEVCLVCDQMFGTIIYKHLLFLMTSMFKIQHMLIVKDLKNYEALLLKDFI